MDFLLHGRILLEKILSNMHIIEKNGFAERVTHRSLHGPFHSMWSHHGLRTRMSSTLSIPPCFATDIVFAPVNLYASRAKRQGNIDRYRQR